MNTHLKWAHLVGAAMLGLCVPAMVVSASAQPPVRFAIDSVSNHVRTHPKPKKATAAPAAALVSSAAKASKATREVPAIVTLPTPASQARVAPTTTRRVAPLPTDSTPAVRRAAAVAKRKPPR